MRGFRCVVAPTDFSRGADRAVDRAANLPLAATGRLDLVHVMPPGTGEALKADRKRALDRVVARVVGRKGTRQGLRVEGRLLTGEPHVEIIRYARSVDADLLVVGRKGSGRALKSTLGTTVARVVRMGDVPVLVASAHSASAPYKRPLVATDVDPSVRRIIDLVRRLVGDAKLKKLDLVHAYHVPFEGFLSAGTPARPSTYQVEMRDIAAKALDDVLRTLRDTNVRINPLLRKGDPRSVIYDEAMRRRADLIALGTHARSGLARALLGSVAEWVVCNAPQDVLIARPVRFTFRLP